MDRCYALNYVIFAIEDNIKGNGGREDWSDWAGVTQPIDTYLRNYSFGGVVSDEYEQLSRADKQWLRAKLLRKFESKEEEYLRKRKRKNLNKRIERSRNRGQNLLRKEMRIHPDDWSQVQKLGSELTKGRQGECVSPGFIEWLL